MSPSNSNDPAAADATAVADGSTTTTSGGGGKLQFLNYANVAAFAMNCFFTFGATPILGLPDNASLSNKYQTIVTPSGYAFSIWGIIFVAEFIWTACQFALPSYRSSPDVVQLVRYNYVWACVAQSAWSIVFGLEHMVLSWIAMVGILIPLVRIVNGSSSSSDNRNEDVTVATDRSDSDDGEEETGSSYWVLRFPFDIHGGWIMAATLVNTNVVLVALGCSSKEQAIAGYLSLAVAVLVGLYYVVIKKKKAASESNFASSKAVVPLVLVWALFAISKELSNPKQLIVDTFDETTIDQTKKASEIAGTVLLCAVLFAEPLRQRLLTSTPLPSSDDTSGGSYSALN